MKEIPIEDLQHSLCSHKEWFYILSKWIDVLKNSFPDAEIINYYGSRTGRVNGILYEFKEGFFMMNNAPKIIKSLKQ